MTRKILFLIVFGFLASTGIAQICSTPAPYIWYQPGLVHKPSVGVGNDVKTITITPPVTYQFTRLTIEMDVLHAGWAPAPGNGNGPSDYHVIFWCERGAWQDNLFGFVSVRGPGKNELDQQTNLDFNGNQVTAVSRSKIYLTPGEKYHFKHIYDSKMQSVFTIVSHNGIDIAYTMQPSTTVNPIQTPNSTVPGKPDEFHLWLAHEANTPGPEVPTYGWEYSNVLFKLENNPLDPPIANFTMSDADPVSGQAVTFDAGLADGALNAWTWNMGDGSAPKTGKTITHTYAAAGNYNVSLIVDDAQGCKDTLYRTVTVANPPPADLKSKTPVRYLPADPHYLEYNGKFELFSGYYPNMGAWTNFPTALWYENIDISTFYKNYIDLAVSKGLNYCRAPLTFGMPSVNKRDQNIHPYLRTGPGNAGDGKPKFDLSKFNPAFFDYWRDVFQYAYSKGVVMQISIFDGAHVRGECADPATAWDYYFGASNINGVDAVDNKKWHDVNQTSSFNAQKAFVDKVIDELNHYPNIIWEVCNENLVSGGSTWDLVLANHFTAQEAAKGFKPHLVMPRDLPDHESLNHWLNPVAQVRTTLINKLYLNQPLFSDNDCCLEDATPEYRRNRAWGALTAGAQINYFQQKLGDEINFSLPDVQDAMRWVGYTRKFVNTLGVNLPGMVPSDNLVTNGWCLAKPAQGEFVIYLINGGATQVSNLPGVYKATWFDPRNGTFQPAGAGPTFTPPGAGDWVLHIGKPYSDAKAVSVGEPFALGCATNVQPLLVVENIGPVPVTQITIAYRIDAGPVVSKTYSVSVGAGLLIGDAMGLSGNASTVSAGTHTLKIWISTPNSVNDLDNSNDTITTTFTVGTTGQPLPFNESFETTTGGQVPATWTRYDRDAFNEWFVYSMPGNKAMAFNNFSYTGAQNNTDELTLPIIDLSGSSAAWLTFDLSHASRTTATVHDSLEVLISTDCGQTFTSIWGRGGAALSTVPAQSSIFIPAGPADYQKVQIDLSAYTISSQAILRFTNWSNNGNSTLIDNVNISTTVTGMEDNNSVNSITVFPNPTTDMIQVNAQLHNAGELRMKLVNSLGQTVREINCGLQQAGSYISKINISDLPAGIYNILLISENEQVMTKKIVVTK